VPQFVRTTLICPFCEFQWKVDTREDPLTGGVQLPEDGSEFCPECSHTMDWDGKNKNEGILW
jgi:hypothetical protein